MTIRLADSKDKQEILKYDRHICPDRLDACIRNHWVYLLCAQEQIVGVLRCSLFWQSIPFLDLLYIDENYRGRGYGSRLMAHWEAALRAENYQYAMLSTQEDETAKHFYEKLNYRRIGAFLPPEQTADELMYLKVL